MKALKTINEAKQWALDNTESLDQRRLSCKDKDVRDFNRMVPELSKRLWDSGCWLAEQLRAHGATTEQVRDTQTAQGQRAFGGDAWQAAVDYAKALEK